MEDKINFSDILKELKGSKEKAVKALINEYEKAQKKQKETSGKLKKVEKERQKLWERYGTLQDIGIFVRDYEKKGKSVNEAIAEKYNCIVDHSKNSKIYTKHVSIEKMQDPDKQLKTLARVKVYQEGLKLKFGEKKIKAEVKKLENKLKKIDPKLKKAAAKYESADKLLKANKQKLGEKYSELQGKEEKNQSKPTQERLDKRKDSAVSKSNSLTQEKTQASPTRQNDLQK